MSLFRGLARVRFCFAHRRMIRDYFESNQPRKLQIGSGIGALEGWLNTDINPTKEIAFLDATKKLPFDDCTFDYIFCEHLIEHLEYLEGEKLVQECFRVLKLGGKLRISTPDLRFLIELYAENKSELQKRYIIWVINTFLPDIGIYLDTFVINNCFRAWGHKFIYDSKTLKSLLEKCGFANITRYDPGESDDKNFLGIESHGRGVRD